MTEEKKLKIFLILCFLIIVILTVNNWQKRPQSPAKVVPSIEAAYRAIDGDDIYSLKKFFSAGLHMEDANIWQNTDMETGQTYDIKGLTPLGYAVYMQHPKVAEWLIDEGADVNVKMPTGGSVFSWAVLYKMEGVIVKLLEHGGIEWEDGYNPANQARSVGHEDIVSLLASYGIYPDIPI